MFALVRQSPMKKHTDTLLYFPLINKHCTLIDVQRKNCTEMKLKSGGVVRFSLKKTTYLLFIFLKANEFNK
jgi:hypothetical protein